MINSKRHLYISVWNKYVPIIRILLKRSAIAEQVLDMNRIDFERVGGIRKAGYKFTVNFINGKPKAIFSGSDLEQSLTTALQEDEKIKEQLLESDYAFTLTTKFQLQISKTPGNEPVLAKATEEMVSLN
jgi:hypothetical protein